MELTGKQLHTLSFRRRRLGDKVRGLEGLISGRGVSLLPQVREEDGRYSEEKTRALVEELLEALDLSVRYRRWNEAQGDALPPLDEACENIRQKRELYRSFLYCAIRVLEQCPTWLMTAKGTYADILRMARRMEYTDRIDLYYAEQDPTKGAEGFFGLMDDLYGRLTGQSILSSVGEAELAAMHTRYAPELQAQEEFERELETLNQITDPEERARFMWEHFGYTEEDEPEWELTEEDWQRIDEQNAEIAQMNRDMAQWEKTFPAREEFCREYLQFRTLYFQTCAWNQLAQTVEEFLDIYLYSRFGTGFMDDGKFFTAYNMLDRTLAQVRRLLSE